MAETLDELQAQLVALNKARAKGISSITYTGNGIQRTSVWKSDREMEAAQNDLMRRIAAMQGSGNRTIRVSASKGLVGDRD